jgi:hypothetical protein
MNQAAGSRGTALIFSAFIHVVLRLKNEQL